MEDLNVQGMLRNHHLSNAIQELDFHTFKNKALLNNKLVIEIDRYYASSKTCNNCGYIYKRLTLNEREWKCPQCGEYHNRDLNAAINILHEGERIMKLNTR